MMELLFVIAWVWCKCFSLVLFLGFLGLRRLHTHYYEVL